MGVIRILPEKVIGQIAAGEVIERPSSVVRELTDNSLDAGSKRVHVLVERGGKKRIKVSDDGCGMDRHDLLLCMERHATSKISAMDDLFSIRSLGFRGEAVPSIGAVSRLEITSRPHDHLVGHKLKVTAGQMKSLDEVGCPPGTVVEVRDLFFNMPVRRRFLKGDKTETDHVLDAFMRIGLPHLQTHFRLEEGEKTLLNLPPADAVQMRLPAFFGKDAVASMVEATGDHGEFKIKVYLGHPDQVRSRADRILFYVNHRHVRDRLLMHATMEGYGQRLMKGRYPLAVVFLEVDPSLVDVNIHPAKHEIRLQQAQLIHQVMIAIIRNALGPEHHPLQALEPGEPKGLSTADPRPLQVSEPFLAYATEPSASSPPARLQVQSPLPLEVDLRILGQVKGTYILCEGREGLFLVDQHAAHERVLYETLRVSYQAAKVESQTFLIPPRLELSVRDSRVLAERLKQLGGLGLEIEPFGGNTFLVRSVPVTLLKVRWESLLSDLIPTLEQGGDLSSEALLDGVLTVMACHGAIRAGEQLSGEEMSALIKQLFATQLPTNCPHGRPTMRTFTYGELERMFKRVV